MDYLKTLQQELEHLRKRKSKLPNNKALDKWLAQVEKDIMRENKSKSEQLYDS